MLRGRFAWLLLSIAALGPVKLAAQAVDVRAEIARFRDSLRSTRDTTLLKALERTWHRAVDSAAAGCLSRARLGFVQLRLGEVWQRRDMFSEAGHTFDVAVAKCDWPVAWIGRGMARINLVESQSTLGHAVQTILSGDPAADAAEYVAHAALADSQFVDGLLNFAAVALNGYHPARLRAALLALRAVAGNPVSHRFDVQLARARMERTVGIPDSAYAEMSLLLAREPANPVVLMEAGLAMFAMGNRRGGEDWFRGLVLADSQVAQWYRSDLVLLLPDSVLRRFDATMGQARADVVRDFLESDDPQQLRTAAERLHEHYRRLDHARLEFWKLVQAYQADEVTAFAPTGYEIDDRGQVWVLHGPPDDHTTFNLLGAPPNESWRYGHADSTDLLFHFIKTDDARGYRHVPSLFDILAFTRAMHSAGHGDAKAMIDRGAPIETYGAGWIAQTAQQLLYSRENLGPMYAQILSKGKDGAAALQAAERAAGDSSMTHRETWNFGFELPLDAHVDVLAVGSDSTGSLLQIAFGIAGSSLYALPGAGRTVYPIRMRVTVLKGRQVIARVDTVRNFVSDHPIAADGMLLGRFPLHVPAGSYDVRVALETASRGMVEPKQTIRVAALGSPLFDLSDLALGARSVRLPWRTASTDTAWVNPLREFSSREPMQLYFEVGGASVGKPYRYELAVFKTGHQDPEFRVASNLVARSIPDPVHREIDLGRLKSGTYDLQVTVTTTAGVSVVRRREFKVVK